MNDRIPDLVAHSTPTIYCPECGNCMYIRARYKGDGKLAGFYVHCCNQVCFHCGVQFEMPANVPLYRCSTRQVL